MSIATMKRLNLLAMSSEKKPIITALQKLGAVQIIKNTKNETEIKADLSLIEQAEAKLASVHFALSLIKQYNKEKKPMLSTRYDVTPEEVFGYESQIEFAEEIINNAKELDQEIFSLKTKRTRLVNRSNTLLPFLNFDASLSEMDNHSKVYVMLGSAPAQAQEAMNAVLGKYADHVYIELDESKKETPVYFIIAYKKACKGIHQELKSAGFVPFVYEDLYGTPRQLLDRINTDIAQIDERIEERTQAISTLIQHKDLLSGMQDYYANVLEGEKTQQMLASTKKTFNLQGYFIDGEQERIEKAIKGVTEVYSLEYEDPAPDEDFPVALMNNRLMKPFEAVTDMYSYPQPRSIDPTLVIAPFYVLFFGMMMSDAGYGVILALLSLLIIRKTRWQGMSKKVLGVVFMGSISTVIWGLLYGGVMGFSITPLWFNPLQDPLTMLILCIGLGIAHLSFGLCVGAYMCFKRGQILDGIFDKLSWVMVLIGLPMLALGGTVGSIGTVLALTGVALIFLFAGRKRPGIVRKIMGGFSSLYGITGYLSDVLSYSRLFGMGLATGVIGMVFNQIAGMVAGSWIGYIFAAAIFCAGHAFNIGINALGAYVHSCRLMYIELFSKFYEDGGKPFKPLSVKSKTYNVVAKKA